MNEKSKKALINHLQTIEALLCDKPLCGHFTAEEIRHEVAGSLRILGIKPDILANLPPATSECCEPDASDGARK